MGQNFTNVKPHFLQLAEPRRVGSPHLGHLKINLKLQFGQTVCFSDTSVLHFGQIKPNYPDTFITLQKILYNKNIKTNALI